MLKKHAEILHVCGCVCVCVCVCNMSVLPVANNLRDRQPTMMKNLACIPKERKCFYILPDAKFDDYIYKR
jgi:hypothetical protein